MKKYRIFENALQTISNPGIQIIQNAYYSVSSKLIHKFAQCIKQKFGVELHNLSAEDFRSYISKFEALCNVTILNEFEVKLFPNITIFKMVKLDPQTYMYVSWGVSQDSQDSGATGYIYLFGKNSYRYCYKLQDPNRSERTTTIYSITGAKSEHEDWQGIMTNAAPRPFDTLYLDNNLGQKIKDHIDRWKANYSIYKSRGIKFKTGLLLYGPPGTGKSSIAAAVAEYLDCSLVIVDSATFNDINLLTLTSSIESDDHTYVILLDDIDVIFKSRDEATTSEDKSNIAKLLGFLDSSNSPDNVVFIATTNHIELLDKAVTRSGRFDKVFEISNISHSTAIRMCEGFGLSLEESRKLVSKQPDNVNPADLQVEILDALKQNINKEH